MTPVEFQSDSIPDDVWISIFENLSSPSQLAVLVRTCRRFRSLASKPLIRELRWGRVESTERNLDAWSGSSVYRDLVALPRKVAIGINFEFCSRNYWPFMTDEMRLHDSIYAQLQNFTMLHELVLNGTALSPYTYTVLAALPSLHSLSIQNCVFICLETPFSQHRSVTHIHFTAPLFDFSSLPLTSLRLHKISSPVDPGPGFSSEDNPHHPMHLITTPNLRSLSIMWTSSRALMYAHKNWSLSNIEHLEVIMPFLTRDLVDSLLGFVARCHPDVRIALSIERHNLSEQQITGVQIPLKGVWKYRGPLSFATFWPHGGGKPTLTHLVMNEAQDLNGLLHGLEKLPKCIRALDVQVRKWDIELLFAIRELFPDICYLVVRYGRGILPADFFVTLGANILYDLPHLNTLKLLNDKSCFTDRSLNPQAQIPVWGGPGPLPPPTAPHHHPHPHPHPHHHWGFGNMLSTFDVFDDNAVEELSSAGDVDSEQSLEQEDLKDYLVGWNRYCKCLRHVQLDNLRWWERRFEGDAWVEVEVLRDS